VKKRKPVLVNWPIGTKVRMVKWEMCGSQVVLLEGKSGGFDTSCLEVIENVN